MAATYSILAKTKTKPIVEIKTAQYVHDIELHFTEKGKKTQTRKVKRFLSKSKGCRVGC